MITLYSAATPNGHKVSIALEELDIPYQLRVLDLGNKEQKEAWYLEINPNGRIPAIIDHEADNFAVFESGAILVYLAEKAGKLMPTDTKGRSLVMQWLMFQMGGIGPMMGQANVFYRYFPEKIQPAIDRYQSEVRRLFGVMDSRLATQEFLAGGYSIADIANWPWISAHEWSGVSLDPFPNLKRWLDQIGTRPAVQRGIERPVSLLKATAENSQAAENFVAEARKILETGKPVASGKL